MKVSERENNEIPHDKYYLTTSLIITPTRVLLNICRGFLNGFKCKPQGGLLGFLSSHRKFKLCLPQVSLCEHVKSFLKIDTFLVEID